MTMYHRPSVFWKKVLVLAAACGFLLFLREFLIRGAVADPLKSNTQILVYALTGIVLVMLVGCFFCSRITSYIMALALLMGIGFCYQFFFKTKDFQQHVLFGSASMVLTIAVYRIYRRINELPGFLFYLAAAAVAGLLAANLVFGEEVNGARLWINLGSFSFQPGELVKVLLIVMGGSTAKKPTRVIAYCALAMLSCLVLLYLRDLGSVAVIFATFVVATYLLFDNRIFSAGIILGAVTVLIIAVNRYEYAARRIENWGAAMSGGVIQQRDFIIATLLGGIRGLGTEYYWCFTERYVSYSDGALAGVFAILGVAMAAVTLGIYAFLVYQTATNKSIYNCSFLLLSQISMFLTVQVLLNFCGSLDVLPFTGIVAPWISRGGTSMLCNGILFGLGAAALDPKLKYYEEV